MRYLAIGDIHGCFTALNVLIEYIDLQEKDILITLGDYVDKGHHVPEVLDYLIHLKSYYKLIPIRGNHDIMMLRSRNNHLAYENWLCMGGISTIEAYGSIESVPESHWQFLQKSIPYWEVDKHFFVHGGVRSNLPLTEQPDYNLYWQRLDEDSTPHESGKVMICGHTAQKNGEPLNLGHSICIDTWACGEGWLTCLDVISGEFWQTNEKKATRNGQLNL